MFINTKQSFQSEGIKPGERNVGKYGQECSVYFGGFENWRTFTFLGQENIIIFWVGIFAVFC